MTELQSVGQRVERLIREMLELHDVTGLEYFKAQASAWCQWVWMLQEKKREDWKLTIVGDAQGCIGCMHRAEGITEQPSRSEQL
jgi:hypothetical protein